VILLVNNNNDDTVLQSITSDIESELLINRDPSKVQKKKEFLLAWSPMKKLLHEL